MDYANATNVMGTTNPDFGGPNARHLETAVFGFADGHVKSARIESYYGVFGSAKGKCMDISVGCQ